MTRADRVVLALEHFIQAKIEYNVDDESETATESLNAARLQLVSLLLALLAKEDVR